MAFLLRSRLFGFLLLLAALPVDPATAALAAGAGSAANVGDRPDADALSVEARLRRIAASARERDGGPSAEQGRAATGLPGDVLAYVFVNGPRVGWRNGGFYNGGFRNGGFWNGGFRNGGGWRNGGFNNGGFRNGGGFRNFW
jgi:rSAM-associated Gly-rich repeat protein